jgi:hypothetical protein
MRQVFVFSLFLTSIFALQLKHFVVQNPVAGKAVDPKAVAAKVALF